jgi:hypothetical protein
MDQKYKPPPAIPETVICAVLTDAIATGATAGLSWEGHGCSGLLHKWAANQLLIGLYDRGYQISRKGYLIKPDR